MAETPFRYDITISTGCPELQELKRCYIIRKILKFKYFEEMTFSNILSKKQTYSYV